LITLVEPQPLTNNRLFASNAYVKRVGVFGHIANTNTAGAPRSGFLQERLVSRVASINNLALVIIKNNISRVAALAFIIVPMRSQTINPFLSGRGLTPRKDIYGNPGRLCRI
jgi:hypothetical protein